MSRIDDHDSSPPEPAALGSLGLRTAVLVAVVTMLAAALLLGFGGWGPDFCSALRSGYPLCAL